VAYKDLAKKREKDRKYRESHHAELAAKRKAERHAEPLKTRDWYFRKTYNISASDVERLYKLQAGKCAVCGDQLIIGTKRLHIDHNHITGKVRGLLCLQCNAGIGSFDDSVSILFKAAAYLEKHLQDKY